MSRPNMRKLLAAANKHFAPRGVRITFNSDYQEYRVNYIGGKEATAYYTDDFNDAEGTAQDFVARRATHTEHMTRNPRKRRAKKSAKRRTVKRGKHVTAKRRVVKRETLRRNPTRYCIIEALTLNGYTPKYFYWNDAAQNFTTKREQASPYASDKAARIEAKKLAARLPAKVRSLRVVPK